MTKRARFFYLTFMGQTAFGKTQHVSRLVAYDDGVVDILGTSRELQAERAYPELPLVYFSLELSRHEFSLAMERSKGIYETPPPIPRGRVPMAKAFNAGAGIVLPSNDTRD